MLVTPSTWKSQHLCFLLAVRPPPPPPPPPPGMTDEPLEAELTTAVLMACGVLEGKERAGQCHTNEEAVLYMGVIESIDPAGNIKGRRDTRALKHSPPPPPDAVLQNCFSPLYPEAW